MHNFTNIVNRLTALSLLTLFVAVPSAQAQETPAPQPFGSRDATKNNGIYTPPPIFVKDLTYDAASERGSFTLLNNGTEAVGDLLYRVEILGALPSTTAQSQLVEDTASLYARELMSQTIISLAGKENKSVQFSYKTPALPSGAYRLRIQVTTSKGRDLGWRDVNFTSENKKISFVELVPGTIESAEYPNQILPPLSGPNIKPESEITLNATAQNKGAKSVTVIPFFEVSKKSASSPANAIIKEGEAVTLSAGSSKTLSLNIQAPTAPGAYRVDLTLRDKTTKNIISPLVEYRFVVRGSTAQIISLRARELKLNNKKQLPVAVEVVGPADAETSLKGKLSLEVFDGKGVVGTFNVPEELELTDAVNGGTAQITLARDVINQAGLRATLTDASGNLLDKYEVPLEQLQNVGTTKNAAKDATPSLPVKKQISTTAFFALLLLILAGATALLVYLIRRRKQLPTTTIVVFLMALAAGVTASAALAYGTGNGIEVKTPTNNLDYKDWDRENDWSSEYFNAQGDLVNKPVISLFVNEPIHEGTYDKSNVPVSFRIEWAVCDNGVWSSAADIHYLKEGGKISTWQPETGKTYLQTMPTYVWKSLADNNCSKKRCILSRTLTTNGGFNLSNIQSGVANTTMRLMARWTDNPWTESATDYSTSNWAVKENAVHAVNLWLNLTSLSCTSDKASAATGENIAFNVAGGNGTYNWSAPGGTPVSGTGASFTSNFSNVGSKNVSVTDSAGKVGQCAVTINYPALACVANPNPAETNQSVSFTAAGGNPNNNFFKFLEGTTIVQRGTNNVFSKSYSSTGAKTIAVQRCDGLSACSDGLDNDNDGKTDFPDDAKCASTEDNNEWPDTNTCTASDPRIVCIQNELGVSNVPSISQIAPGKSLFLWNYNEDRRDLFRAVNDCAASTGAGVQFISPGNINAGVTAVIDSLVKSITSSYAYVIVSGNCDASTLQQYGNAGPNVFSEAGQPDCSAPYLTYAVNYGANKEISGLDDTADLKKWPAVICDGAAPSASPSCDPAGTCSVNVAAPAPKIEVTFEGSPVADGGTAEFGEHYNTAANVTKSMTVKNIGTSNLVITGASIQVDANAIGNYSMNGSLNSVTLAPNESRSVTLEFDPQRPGKTSVGGTFGALLLDSNASNDGADNLFTVILHGSSRLAPVAPTVDLTVGGKSGDVRVKRGETKEIKWVVANAASCTASGSWTGSKTATGGTEQSGAITSARTYSLTCTSSENLSTTDVVNVNVYDVSPIGDIQDL